MFWNSVKAQIKHYYLRRVFLRCTSHMYRNLSVSKLTFALSAYLYLHCPGHLLISPVLQNNNRGRKLSSFVPMWPWQKSKTERKRKQCFFLQHLVQSAPWGWTPTGGLVPVVKESGGWEPALFLYSIKYACRWSALWITCRALSNKSI